LGGGSGQGALFDLLVPKPEKTYQWRVELDCGWIRDTVFIRGKFSTDLTTDKICAT